MDACLRKLVPIRARRLAAAALGVALLGAVPCAFCGAATRARANDASPATAPSEYLPLSPGTTWKYRVHFTLNGEDYRPVFQTVTVGQPIQHGAITLIPIGNDLYQVQPDGIYFYGRLEAPAADQAANPPPPKIVALDTAEKIIPAHLAPDDRWNWTSGPNDDPRGTFCTCTGAQAITTPAGTFQTLCVESATSDADQKFKRNVQRYFAPGVGIVREITTETVPGSNGKIETHQTTRELQSYSVAKAAETPAVGKTAAPALTPAQTPPAHPANPNAAAAQPTAGALFEQGKALARDHQYDQALAKYTDSLRIDPRQADVYAYMALCHLAMHKPDQAQQAIDRARSLDQRLWISWEIAGQIKVARGKAAEARPLYDKAASLSPRDAGVIYTDLAAALAAAQDDSLAGAIQSALEQAANSNPPSAEALFQLGQGYANAGKPQAISYLNRYLDVEKQLPAEQQDAVKMRIAKQLIRAMEALEQ